MDSLALVSLACPAARERRNDLCALDLTILALQEYEPIQVVGQDPKAQPHIRSVAAAQLTAAPAVLATPETDGCFLPAAPALLATEPPLVFIGPPLLPEPSFIWKTDLSHLAVLHQGLVGLAAKPAISGPDVRRMAHRVHVPLQRRLQKPAIPWIPQMRGIVGDHSLLRFRQQRLIAKLGFGGELPAPNRVTYFMAN